MRLTKEVGMFLYHMIPKRLVGNVLLPLNTLKTVSAPLYEEQVAKYVNRPHVLQSYIAPLECGWSDVVFLTPVHPVRIKRALRIAGFLRRRIFNFYEIDASSLHSELAIIWLGHAHGRRPDSYLPYEVERLKLLQNVTKETQSYYTHCKKSGEKPLLWHALPHVLYKGEIDIRSCRSLTV